jgi:flagellar hook-associated protein 3 FlgL
MRVTPGSVNAQLTSDLQTSLAALAKQEAMIASGRRINAPADDPGGTAAAFVFRSRQAANAQYQKNIDTVRSSLSSADTTVRSLINDLQQAQDLAVQGSNDTNDAISRQAIGTQIDQILESTVAAANTRNPAGSMVFGGQEVTVAPYTVTRDVTGKITAVTVNSRGIDGQTPAAVSDGITIAQGVSGNTVFGAMADPTNAFSTLIRLRDALNNNDGVGTRAEIDNLATAHDRAVAGDEIVGTRLGWLDSLESRLKDESLTLSSSLSSIEDVDMPKAVTDMQQIQTFYQAGLAAGAKMLQQSLVDFLK